MSPTIKALLIEALAELVAVSGVVAFRLREIFAQGGTPQQLRDLAKQIREGKLNDGPPVA